MFIIYKLPLIGVRKTIRLYKAWLCTKLGHSYNINTIRLYNGYLSCDCYRCKETIIKETVIIKLKDIKDD